MSLALKLHLFSGFVLIAQSCQAPESVWTAGSQERGPEKLSEPMLLAAESPTRAELLLLDLLQEPLGQLLCFLDLGRSHLGS